MTVPAITQAASAPQDEACVVFTGMSLEQLIAAGFTGDWVAKQRRLEACRYLLICQNRHSKEPGAKPTAPHRSVILAAEISRVVPGERRGGLDRYRIHLASVATINIQEPVFLEQDAFPFRNPVAYTTCADLQRRGIDLGDLDFMPLDSVSSDERIQRELVPYGRAQDDGQQRIDIADLVRQTKIDLATMTGFTVEQIEITFRG
ncbi:hypothetical protein [Methylobacterium sp. D48H]